METRKTLIPFGFVRRRVPPLFYFPIRQPFVDKPHQRLVCVHHFRPTVPKFHKPLSRPRNARVVHVLDRQRPAKIPRLVMAFVVDPIQLHLSVARLPQIVENPLGRFVHVGKPKFYPACPIPIVGWRARIYATPSLLLTPIVNPMGNENRLSRIAMRTCRRVRALSHIVETTKMLATTVLAPNTHFQIET